MGVDPDSFQTFEKQTQHNNQQNVGVSSSNVWLHYFPIHYRYSSLNCSRSDLEGVVVVDSFEAAIDAVDRRSTEIDQVFVIGGSSVYEVQTVQQPILICLSKYNIFSD